MKVYRSLWLSGLGLTVVALVACGGLTRSDKPASSTWLLNPYVAANQTSPPASSLTSVEVSLTVVPGLDTERILTLSRDAQLNHFSNARWADNLPELLTSLVSRTVQSSAQYILATGDANCELQLEVQAFFAHTDLSGHATNVKLGMDGWYGCGSGERSTISLKVSQPIGAENMGAIVAAFQLGMDRMMVDLLEKMSQT